MTRARDGARRFPRSSSSRALALHPALPFRAAALALLAALLLAACGTTTVTPSGPSGSPTGPANASPAPGTEATPPTGGTTEPAAPSGSPGGPSTSGESASPAPDGIPGGSGSPAGGDGSAAACSGLPTNRDFFAAAAAALDWDVYCGVFPEGWFVETGSYRLRDGGQLTIAYRGPNGARLELRQGAFCGDPNGCVPSGQEQGQAAFGDRQGTLVVLDGGGYAIVVDRGAPISWLAIGANLDEASFRALVAALHRVTG